MFPNGLSYIPKVPTINTLNWLKHKQIAYSKAMRKAERRVA